MKKTLFTQRDFLKACDLINQVKGEAFGIWFESGDLNGFSAIFKNKKKAKEVLYEKIGLKVYGYNIFDINNPYGM